MTPLLGIACFYDVGFGARAVSRKTPIYFIFLYKIKRKKFTKSISSWFIIWPSMRLSSKGNHFHFAQQPFLNILYADYCCGFCVCWQIKSWTKLKNMKTNLIWDFAHRLLFLPTHRLWCWGLLAPGSLLWQILFLVGAGQRDHFHFRWSLIFPSKNLWSLFFASKNLCIQGWPRRGGRNNLKCLC